jgi:hypothetical protein
MRVILTAEENHHMTRWLHQHYAYAPHFGSIGPIHLATLAEAFYGSLEFGGDVRVEVDGPPSPITKLSGPDEAVGWLRDRHRQRVRLGQVGYAFWSAGYRSSSMEYEVVASSDDGQIRHPTFVAAELVRSFAGARVGERPIPGALDHVGVNLARQIAQDDRREAAA